MLTSTLMVDCRRFYPIVHPNVDDHWYSLMNIENFDLRFVELVLAPAPVASLSVTLVTMVSISKL